jgi:hypothetical protein
LWLTGSGHDLNLVVDALNPIQGSDGLLSQLLEVVARKTRTPSSQWQETFFKARHGLLRKHCSAKPAASTKGLLASAALSADAGFGRAIFLSSVLDNLSRPEYQGLVRLPAGVRLSLSVVVASPRIRIVHFFSTPSVGRHDYLLKSSQQSSQETGIHWLDQMEVDASLQGTKLICLPGVVSEGNEKGLLHPRQLLQSPGYFPAFQVWQGEVQEHHVRGHVQSGFASRMPIGSSLDSMAETAKEARRRTHGIQIVPHDQDV